MRKRFIVVPLIILAVIGLMTVGVDLMQKYTEQRLKGSGTTDENHGCVISEKTLNVGKYYEDGDTDKSYFEIYGDGTMQWKGMDFDKFVRDNYSYQTPNKEDYEKDMNDKADYYSAKHEYTIVDFYSINVVMIAWEWTEDQSYIQGCEYINKNTFSTCGLTFEYIE